MEEGVKGKERWADRKAAECVFPDSKAHDSAWLIKKISQETLVRSIPSSPLLSFLQYSLSGALLPLLHSLPLIQNFRRSYLHKQFSMKKKNSPCRGTSFRRGAHTHRGSTHGWIQSGLVKDSCSLMSPLNLSRQKYIRFVQLSFQFPSVWMFCWFCVIHFVDEKDETKFNQ